MIPEAYGFSFSMWQLTTSPRRYIYGVYRSQHQAQNQQALAQFLVPLAILDFDYDAALAYGHIRGYLETLETPIGSLDTLIAAYAISRQLTLITNTAREFARVPGLAIEDWSLPEPRTTQRVPDREPLAH